jgi:hypothetical protein
VALWAKLTGSCCSLSPPPLPRYANSAKKQGGDTFTNVVRVLYAFAIVLTVPLICFPMRKCIEEHVLFRGKPFSWPRHIIITICIISFVTIIALFVPAITAVSLLMTKRLVSSYSV